MSGINALYDACEQLLIAASEACALTEEGAMERVFVSPGPPAWDCPNQLTVHAGSAVEADTAPLQPPLQPARRIDQARMLNMATLTITALRCAPVLDQQNESLVLPTVDALDAAGKVVMQDLWAIWNHIATQKRNGTLFPPHTRELIFDPAVPLSAQGGIAGWQIQVRVQVDGYKTN